MELGRDRARQEGRPVRQLADPGGGPGKLIWGDARLHAELAYCVPLGIPHSSFLSWDPLDQDKALAWQREQAKVCGGCGTRKEEWDRDRFAYVGQIDHCPGCELLAQEHEHLKDSEEKGQRGLTARLVPKATAKREDPQGA